MCGILLVVRLLSDIQGFEVLLVRNPSTINHQPSHLIFLLIT